jgi:hypothetical protein
MDQEQWDRRLAGPKVPVCYRRARRPSYCMLYALSQIQKTFGVEEWSEAMLA